MSPSARTRLMNARRHRVVGKPMLRPEEVASLLGCSIPEVYQRIPRYVLLGPRTHRFDLDDVNVALYGETTALWAERFASPSKHARPGTVYFAEASGSDRIKIGWTGGKPQRRVAEIQTNSPFEVELLAWAPGSLAMEAGLHARFEESRVSRRTEWFHATSELRALIDRVRSSGELP